MKLRLAYFGTPDFSARFLEKLIQDAELPIELKLVVTQPDKPVGRKQILTPSPVKVLAQTHGVEVWDKNLKRETLNLKQYDIDLALLYAYGEIIHEDLLSTPRYGFWNIHPSLLPKYRGASPSTYPLILGDTTTGVTLMKMDHLLDHGPIISQEKYEISLVEKRGEIEERLTDLGFTMFQNAIKRGVEKGERSPLLEGRSPPLVIQKNEDAIFTKLLDKNDGFIEFNVLKSWVENKSAITANLPKIILEFCQRNSIDLQTMDHSPRLLYNLFRGLHPWPGIWTLITHPSIVDGADTNFRAIWDVDSGVPSPDRGPTSSEKIQYQAIIGKRLKITDIEYIDNQLVLKRVQLEGKNEVDFPTFNNAYKIFQ